MAARNIVHVEFPANNRIQSAQFFQQVFGWDYTDQPEYNYTLLSPANMRAGLPDIDGSFYKQDDVIVYIESDDLEADLKAIEANGGQRMGEIMTVAGWGQLSFFTDPAGNRLALWKDTSMA